MENCTFNASGTNPVTTPLSGAWMSDLESASAAAIGNGATITTSGVKSARVVPAAPVTGAILQVGSYQGQEITVVNEAGATNTVTFAALATSHVANGVSSVIAGATARRFTWDVGFNAWFPNT